MFLTFAACQALQGKSAVGHSQMPAGAAATARCASAAVPQPVTVVKTRVNFADCQNATAKDQSVIVDGRDRQVDVIDRVFGERSDRPQSPEIRIATKAAKSLPVAPHRYLPGDIP